MKPISVCSTRRRTSRLFTPAWNAVCSKKPYPNMDMVSIGPTITGPHSPDEQVHIESVGQYWTLLTELLKAIPAK